MSRVSPEDLRRRIEKARTERGLTQVQLAEALETSQGTISGWLSGGSLPNAELIMRLPGALNVSGHWLLTEDGPMERVGPEVRTSLELARAEFALELEAAARRVLAELLEKMRSGLFAAVAKQLSPAPTPERIQQAVRDVASAAAKTRPPKKRDAGG